MTVSTPTPTTQPLILQNLPDLKLPGNKCSLHTQQRIDLFLLALESLELGGSEYMLASAKELELQGIIKGRLNLWRLRCTNPWRKAHHRTPLTLTQAKSLAILIHQRAKQLTILIRNLLLAEQQMREKNLPVGHHFRLSEYLDRFRSHFRSRMNARRTKVADYLANEDELDELAMSLLNQLMFCSGTAGLQRLWISLFDGEVV